MSITITKLVGACAVALCGLQSPQALAEEPKPPKTIEAGTYLADVSALFKKQWPTNRTVNVVCHGHSVPAGYFLTPVVDSLNSYPHLLFTGLKARFPFAVVNVIVTAIGGEDSERGAARFEKDVLSHNPDVVCIDYALNDRGLGVERSRRALVSMITKAKEKQIKVLLLTPTAALSAKLDNAGDPLNQQAAMIKALAKEQEVGLVDSLAEFQSYVTNGGKLADLMCHENHPNRKGHELVAKKLLEWFPE